MVQLEGPRLIYMAKQIREYTKSGRSMRYERVLMYYINTVPYFLTRDGGYCLSTGAANLFLEAVRALLDENVDL